VTPRALQQDGGRTSPGPEALTGPPRYLLQGQADYDAACPDGKLYHPEVGAGGVFIANGFFLRDARPFPPAAPAAHGQT